MTFYLQKPKIQAKVFGKSEIYSLDMSAFNQK